MIYVLARSCLAQWDETEETYPPDSWDPVLIMELGWRFHPVLQGQESLKAPFVYLKRTRLNDLGDVDSAKKHMWHGNPVGWPSKLNPVIFHILKEQLLCLVGKLDSGAFNKTSKFRSTSAINALFTLDYLARAVLSETNPPWTIQDTYEKWQSTRLVVSRLALELFDESDHASWRNSVNRCWW